MKLIRFGHAGAEKPGVECADGTRLDVSKHIPDYNPDFFAAGGLARLSDIVSSAKGCPKVDPNMRLGPPVAKPGKFMAIGLNYRGHAKEMAAPIPKQPEVFTKQTSCICGPNDDILLFPDSVQLDYEVEFAFVVGRRAHRVQTEAEAQACVAGYMICNDVSERQYQTMGAQWTQGKSGDTYGPLGPWLVCPDEVGDPHQLRLTTKVNGEIRQDSNTNDLIFNIPQIIMGVSKYITLLPGDCVTTGTPAGVAHGMNDPSKFLKVGDEVELTIEKLGTQKNRIVAYAEA